MAHDFATTPDGSGCRLDFEPLIALHLLWTLGIAFVATYAISAFAALQLCGIDGCSAADAHSAWTSFLSVPVVGVLFGLAVGLVPWLYPVRARVAVAVITGLVPASLLAYLLWQRIAPYLLR
jgi:hypothetical protein